MCLTVKALPICHVAIIGDSISTGTGLMSDQSWVEQLRHAHKHLRISNHSGAGNTSLEALHAWKLSPQDYDHLIIFIGANDALRGMSSQHLRNNLTKIILGAKKKGITITLISPDVPRNYPKSYRDSYTRVYQHLAKEYKLQLIHLNFLDAQQNNWLGEDGLHPNSAGHRQLYKIIEKQALPCSAHSANKSL